MIDTHSHIYVPEFDLDIDTVIKSFLSAGIDKVILPNIDVESIPQMKALVNKRPDVFYPMMGLHPGSVDADFEKNLSIIEGELNSGKYCAVGEIGMDLYWDKTFIEQQKVAFETQIRWAKEKKLPIAIHVRDAFNEVFEIIDRNHDADLRGVFHCFTGDLEQAKHVMGYKNFKMGIGGVVTYKTSTLPEVLKHVPLEYIVLETDSPYLPPVPFRGKRNETAYMIYVAKKLAEVYQTTLPVIDEVTTQNAKALFGIE